MPLNPLDKQFQLAAVTIEFGYCLFSNSEIVVQKTESHAVGGHICPRSVCWLRIVSG